MSKLGQVIFFVENENGAFNCIGHTGIITFSDALHIYSETPNPASQLIEGDTQTEIGKKFVETINKMSDPKYCEKYIFPTL